MLLLQAFTYCCKWKGIRERITLAAWAVPRCRCPPSPHHPLQGRGDGLMGSVGTWWNCNSLFAPQLVPGCAIAAGDLAAGRKPSDKGMGMVVTKLLPSCLNLQQCRDVSTQIVTVPAPSSERDFRETGSTVNPSLMRKRERLMHPWFSSTSCSPFWSLMIPKVLPGSKKVAVSKKPWCSRCAVLQQGVSQGSSC